MYVQGVERVWTPIKPATAQFAVGRNRTAQVIREQFPLRPAAAKTIHRSQGEEMLCLWTEGCLKLSVTPIYETSQTACKICFLNSTSLHRHIEDVHKDLNYSNMDVNIFSETRLYNVTYKKHIFTIFVKFLE